MIIRDTWDDGIYPPRELPSVTELLHGMTSEDPITALRACRNLRHLIDVAERSHIQLALAEGYTETKIGRLIGRSFIWVRARSGRLRD